MGKAKSIDEMTVEEKQAYWAKQREQEAMVREALLFQLRDKYPSMLQSVEELVKAASSVGDDLQWSGARFVTVDDMHTLIDSANTVKHLFHLDVEEHG